MTSNFFEKTTDRVLERSLLMDGCARSAVVLSRKSEPGAMDEQAVLQMQKSVQDELKLLKTIGQKLQELMVPRSKLLSQKNENEMVKKEMDLLNDNSVVYKLVGPVLVKQEVDDAKLNVTNRLKFINAELERIEKQAKELETQQRTSREKIMKLQDTFRAAEQATVQKALSSSEAGRQVQAAAAAQTANK